MGRFTKATSAGSATRQLPSKWSKLVTPTKRTSRLRSRSRYWPNSRSTRTSRGSSGPTATRGSALKRAVRCLWIDLPPPRSVVVLLHTYVGQIPSKDLGLCGWSLFVGRVSGNLLVPVIQCCTHIWTSGTEYSLWLVMECVSYPPLPFRLSRLSPSVATPLKVHTPFTKVTQIHASVFFVNSRPSSVRPCPPASLAQVLRLRVGGLTCDQDSETEEQSG